MEIKELKHKCELLQELSGVYIFKNKNKEIIYIGKARNLKERVNSYFNKNNDGRIFFSNLLSEIDDIETMITSNEKEALILENELVKKYKPKFNILLKDDKNFLYIKINKRTVFPRLELVRRRKKDNSIYFGPYHSASAVRNTFYILNKYFGLRTCQDIIYKNRTKPCIEYQINRCSAPCVGKVKESDYMEYINNAISFLQGNEKLLISKLEERMMEASKDQRFEEAANLRDQISAIKKSLSKQNIVLKSTDDIDVFGIFREGDDNEVYILSFKNGALRGGMPIRVDSKGLQDNDFLTDVIKRFYCRDVEIPSKIILPFKIYEKDLIEEWLGDKKGGKITIIEPQRGELKNILKMAEKNAEISLKERRGEESYRIEILEKLKEEMNLKKTPLKIECIDISNIGGKEACGAVVVFEKGSPKKNEYRIYKIKTLGGIDDYAMIGEVLRRRLARGVEEGNLPDLIIIDGGFAHLQCSLKIKREFGLDDIYIISIAKERDEKIDRIYIPAKKDPIFFPENSPLLLFLMKIRDEAHRFSITFHRKLRMKKQFTSPLDKIKGIGKKRKKLLLTHFGSIKNIFNASIENLMMVKGINKKQAEEIYNHFHGSDRTFS